MIKLYGFEECEPCQQIKRLLEKFGIKYKYIDVLKNNISFTVVPVLELDDGTQFKGLGDDVTKYIRDLGKKYRKAKVKK